MDPDAASIWISAPSGDGFEAAWNYRNPDKILESSQFNRISRSDDGGNTWERLSLPGSGPFVTRIANSKQDPDLVFASSNLGILKSNDFGTSWEIIDMPGNWRFSRTYGPPIAISLASPQIVWTGEMVGPNSGIVISRDGGNTFEPTSTYDQADLGVVTSIHTHPFNPATAYATFSMADGPKILRTTDFGANWEDISGFVTNREESLNGFPDVAVYSLVVLPFDTNRIWAGTEIGLFESLDNGQSWNYSDNGLSAVSIWDMKVVNDQVILGTHGRGIWTVKFEELAGYEPLEPDFLAPKIVLEGEGFDYQLIGTFQLRSSYDSTVVVAEVERLGSNTPEIIPIQELKANNEPIDIPFDFNIEGLPGDTILEATIRITSFKDGAGVGSIKRVLIYDVETEPQSAFLVDFDAQDSRVARLGFNVQKPAGFLDQGLHTAHPYENLSTYLAILKTPILLSEENAELTFDEIVLVETGESDVFGDPEFYDFVVVEGTTNRGADWKVLKGYDSSLKQTWENAYDNGEDGRPELYLKQSLDLLSFFEPGETVYLRFRLTSDPLVNGWGWAIDNLKVGDPVVSLEGQRSSKGMDVTVFPNPIQGKLQLELTLEQSATLALTLTDLSGKSIYNLGEQEFMAGENRFNADLPTLPKGIYFLIFRGEDGLWSEKVIIQ